MNSKTSDHLLFWAKTPSGPHSVHPYKPVGHHLLDVAACVFHFLQANPNRLAREARLTGLSPEQHVHLCALFAALHDLGKISRAFQRKIPALWPKTILGEIGEREADLPSHWVATGILLYTGEVRDELSKSVPTSALTDQMIAAIAGHHGQAPVWDDLKDAYISRFAARTPGIGQNCVSIAAELASDIADLFPLALPKRWSPDRDTNFSFCLNGLITLADWVGSNEADFPFESPDMALADYWPRALARAKTAIFDKGLAGIAPCAWPSLAGLTGATHPPRPMQRLTAEVEFGKDPQIILIEDSTGSGKTEAALLLAARMMAAGLGDGVFVALPTMATANAMHARLGPALGGLFATDAPRQASLVLAHGKAKLASALDRLGASDGARELASAENEDSVFGHFNQWIEDSRKKAFFADAGAGTIDQAFLSVLPKKHLTMRQYALAGRILIVDEAHACDAYMGAELRTLVEMQARLGGSVIILSATLSRRMRQSLVLAFAKGCGVKERNNELAKVKDSVLSGAYPLLTRFSKATGVAEIAVESLPELRRKIQVARVSTRDEAVELAVASAQQGACVAMICNAVDPAIETIEKLLATGHAPEKTTLFHARFTFADRMNVEDKVLRLFGKQSAPQTRAGQILVATQVVEQSLDLDFDVMISDLAPVDLIVQRAGRLWRHKRENRPLSAPLLHVLTADPSDVRQAEWLKEPLGAASYTYRLPGVMWRTARDLLHKGTLETPQDLRHLIETAYQDDSADLPAILVHGDNASEGEDNGNRFMGERNSIKPDNGYSALSAVNADEEIGTRLGQESVTIRLAANLQGTLVPFNQVEGASVMTNWALSEIQVRRAWLAGEKGASPLPLPLNASLVDALRATWPEWEQNIPVYEVLPDGQLAMQDATHFAYERNRGLRKIPVAEH